MPQNDFVIANADGATVRADINSALQALATLSSGATAPATTYAGMLWWDTTANLIKQRNGANAAWITVASFDGTTVIPYRAGVALGTLAVQSLVDGTDIRMGSDAQGDILYFNGTDYVRLPAGTSGQFLETLGAGANPAWATAPGATAITMLDRNMAQLDIVNTAAETTLYSYSVPGGTLGTNKALRVSILGDYLNNSGFSKNFTVKMKYGATTLWGDVTSVPTNTTRRGFKLDMILAAINSTSAQSLAGSVFLSATGAPVTGTGAFFDASTLHSLQVIPGGSSAEDSTAAKTLAATVQHETAAATISLRANIRMIELLS